MTEAFLLLLSELFFLLLCELFFDLPLALCSFPFPPPLLTLNSFVKHQVCRLLGYERCGEGL